MNNCKKLIRKAFEHQLNGDGFSLVELLSPCLLYTSRCV